MIGPVVTKAAANIVSESKALTAMKGKLVAAWGRPVQLVVDANFQVSVRAASQDVETAIGKLVASGRAAEVRGEFEGAKKSRRFVVHEIAIGSP